MTEMAEVRVIFYKDELLKIPSVNCSFDEFLDWLKTDGEPVDWEIEYFYTDEYEERKEDK